MNAWDMYANRIGVRGGSKRESIKNIEIRNIYTNLPDSLSYYDDVTIDGVQQTVAIINSDNLDEKTMISMPGENIKHGGLVHWMDQYWLVIEKDYNNTLYVRTKLQQCNYLLRWVSEDAVIHEQWCIVEDGTKYLTGELEDRHFIVTRGDSRIAITLAKNEDTIKLNRETRLMVDEPGSPKMLCYTLSKPIKLGHSYGDEGCVKFVLQEVTSTGDDNFDLRIADYYKYYPKPNSPIGSGNAEKGWL